MKPLHLTRALLLALGAAGGATAFAQVSGASPLPACAPGTHLEHRSGIAGIVNPDAEEAPAGSEYRCERDTPATALSCGTHGNVLMGESGAFCGCETGYAGDSCNVCAAGYAADAAGACAPIATNRDLVIMGADRVVPYGGSTVLSAEYLTAPGRVATGSWQLRGDPADVGCLAPIDQAGVCLSQVDATQARYSPPAQGGGLTTQQIAFVPSSGIKTQVDIKADMPGQIPINGWASAATLPVVNSVLDFMKARCIGAGSLGIARNGQVVAAIGLGMKDGRNAEAIYNAACSSDATDPFKPNAEEMHYNTPFMFGSVSKATSFATARWAIKNALKAQDIDVRVIAQTGNRFVSAHRTLFGNLRIAVWNADASGNFVEQGAHQPERVKDFQLVRMGDTRFVLITRSDENKLHVYAYSIDAGGQPTVTDTLLGVTDVKEVTVAAITNQRIVVGLRRANDTLQMRTFKLEANNTFTALDTENGGGLRDLSLLALPNSSRVIGAARLAYPDVTKFIVWDVAADGTLNRVHETTFDNFYYDDARIQMTALSNSRIVIGAQQNRSGPLSLGVYSVAGSGALASVGFTALDDVGDFRLQALATDRFAVVAKDAADNGTVQQYTLNSQGWPYRLGASASAGKTRSLDLANASNAGWGMGFVTAARDSGDSLRLTSWDVGASTLVKLKQGTTNLKVTDFGWTDADVESLSLVGYDFPNALIPRRLHEIVAGHVEPPMHFDAKDTRGPKNECKATEAPGYPKADARWKNIRIGDFMAHRAGLNSSTIAAETLIDNNLGQIRGLTTKSQWAAQEDRLRETWGVQNVKDARVAAGLSSVVNYDAPDGFLLPPLTLEETLVGSASMCLPNPHGEYHYSNTDPQWVRMAMEHVSGKRYTAEVGKPEATAGTLLDDFTKSELGFGSTGLDNLFARPAALDAQGKDPFSGPKARHWDGGIDRYYNTYWDLKRPICKWVNGTCSIANPKTGPSLNWNGEMAKVSLLMRSTGQGSATGSLGAQLLPHLKFMAKFRSGGYDSGPLLGEAYDSSIGEARSGSWTDGTSHDGGDDGTYAYAIQFGGKTCGGSAGVDLIVSFNQWKDAQCSTGAESCEGDPMRYQELYNILVDGVCASDWSKAAPVPWLND